MPDQSRSESTTSFLSYSVHVSWLNNQLLSAI